MNGFLLNMINRHQGLVDKVQPRIRSMFEPEPASPAATDNAFASAADTLVKESPDTGSEQQAVFSKSPSIEKSTPEHPPSEPLSVLLQQPTQTDEGSRAYDRLSLDKNRMDLMNEQVQSLLARLAGKPETQEKFYNPKGLQKPESSAATDQTASKVVSNELGLTSRIEETLRRLKNQTSNTIKTVAQPLNKSVQDLAETDNTPISSQDGVLQIPAWLTDMQTNLNNQWREINAKPHAEPVINVTIGRVEVRAINTEPVKPSAAQGKPKGVLSLDDYLKQRESKGRT